MVWVQEKASFDVQMEGWKQTKERQTLAGREQRDYLVLLGLVGLVIRKKLPVLIVTVNFGIGYLLSVPCEMLLFFFENHNCSLEMQKE